MNSVNVVGYIASDPKTNRRESGDEKYVFSEFTLAIPRIYKKEGEATADFIRVRASNKQAEFVEKYMKKGRKIAIAGRLESNAYITKNGTKAYATKIVINTIDFADSSKIENEVDSSAYISSNIDVSGLEGADFQTGSEMT